MSRPETLEKRYVGKVRPAPARRFCRTQWYGFGLHTGTDVAAVCGVASVSYTHLRAHETEADL
eukprot:2262456-Rhodomonas_salina.2